MSMVGYLLGLGDRHPSNLMVDRYSGKVLHIDFGDCFEASMYREKFPEKVPFRLTRMLVHAMEVSGIEGNFRNTCESVVTVLRNNKDSVMAMLEAFVHDPLINWRLLTHNVPAAEDDSMTNSSMEPQSVDTPTPDGSRAPSAGTDRDTPPQLGKAQRQSRPPSVGVIETPSGPVPSSSSVIGVEATHAMAAMGSSLHDTVVPTSLLLRRTELINAMEAYGTEYGQNDALNERAVSVMQRMSAKLTGRDGEHHHPDSMMPDTIEVQVERLIAEAMSAENLSVSYVGWCPWW
jgi:FKBP12-rapamycin complex-associated protein